MLLTNSRLTKKTFSAKLKLIIFPESNPRLTLDDDFLPVVQMVILAFDEDQVDQLLKLLVGHVQGLELRIPEEGKDEGLPEGVHVADGQRWEENLVEGHGR